MFTEKQKFRYNLKIFLLLLLIIIGSISKNGESMKGLSAVRVITLVDNDVWKKGLSSSWGLSLYVEGKQHTVLMDTSGSFDSLFGNASKLGVDLSTIEAVFVSHWHGDHCGSLSHVLPMLRRSTPVYVPSANHYGLRTIVTAGGSPKVCSTPMEFIEGMMSTGVIGDGIEEHSLLINVIGKGLVVLTGCSHPGIINIVKRAQEVSGAANIYAVIGGLHISSIHEGMHVAKSLRKIGVELLSPCHCTGANAKRAIAEVMKEGYLKNGSGKSILIEGHNDIGCEAG